MESDGESVNPFTGMPNGLAMKLQNSWENILECEYGINPIFNLDDINSKLKKSNIDVPSIVYHYAIVGFKVNIFSHYLG